jgi:hypothetical protein
MKEILAWGLTHGTGRFRQTSRPKAVQSQLPRERLILELLKKGILPFPNDGFANDLAPGTEENRQTHALGICFADFYSFAAQRPNGSARGEAKRSKTMADQKNRGGQKKGTEQPQQAEEKQHATQQNGGGRSDQDKRKDQTSNPDGARRQPTNQQD